MCFRNRAHHTYNLNRNSSSVNSLFVKIDVKYKFVMLWISFAVMICTLLQLMHFVLYVQNIQNPSSYLYINFIMYVFGVFVV